VAIGALMTTASSCATCCAAGATDLAFNVQIALWLWFTVLFANFAEAMAEGRGKAQADSAAQGAHRRWRPPLAGRQWRGKARNRWPPPNCARRPVVCEAGDVIPGDGEVVEGIASVDESAITGESAPVIRESGGDRSAVTGGTRVLSDRIVVRITAEQGSTFPGPHDRAG
jgi:K+-transporting ATPase ATPase B chain